MKFGLAQHIIDNLITVFEQHSKVDKALIFGSRAKDNYRTDSDIDIAIKGQDLNTDDIIAMSVAFEEKGITQAIDLINYDAIKEPDLKDHIDRVGIEFYSRWKEYKLGDLVTFQRGHDLPREQMQEGIYPVAGSNSIIGFHNKYTSDCPGITIGRSGNIGNPQLHNTKFWAHNTTLYVKEFKKVNPLFFYYLLKILDFSQLNSGSAVPSLNRNFVHLFKVKIPSSIQEQTAIASVLSSLDDKIDLLYRQNKTLEELAETLFRQWFEMEISKGDLISLSDYVDCINGVSYKSSELNQSRVGMISLKNFDRNGGFSIDGFKEFTGKFKDKQIVVEGDLIVAHTDITQEAEVIGNPALVIDNPNFEIMTISMDIVKVVSKIEWVSNEFLYYLMKTREFKSHCQGCANGSTVLHLNKQAIPTFEFPRPAHGKALEFTKQSKELLKKIFSNHKQLRNLVLLQNALLPKLMSGEVRVKIPEFKISHIKEL